jgi:hypothetical protein
MPECQKRGVAEFTIWKCMKRKNEDERGNWRGICSRVGRIPHTPPVFS